MHNRQIEYAFVCLRVAIRCVRNSYATFNAFDPEPSRKISKIGNIYFALTVVVAVSLPVRLYSEEVLYPAGYEIISTYQLSETNLSLSDTLIIRRTIINNDVFPLNGLFFSENLPPAFYLVSYAATVNGDSIPIQFSGGVKDFVLADYIFYEWVLDKPGASDSIQNRINTGDTAALELKLICDSTGSFVLPLHAAPFYGNGIAFFSSSDPITVDVTGTNCCSGTTGNVNSTGIVDLSDLSALVSYLSGGGYVLPCPDAANVNATSIVDLSDLNALVSYLTGGGYVLPNCQ